MTVGCDRHATYTMLCGDCRRARRAARAGGTQAGEDAVTVVGVDAWDDDHGCVPGADPGGVGALEDAAGSDTAGAGVDVASPSADPGGPGASTSWSSEPPSASSTGGGDPTPASTPSYDAGPSVGSGGDTSGW